MNFLADEGVDFPGTCDDGVLKRAKGLDGLNTKVVSPTELVMELDIWI